MLSGGYQAGHLWIDRAIRKSATIALEDEHWAWAMILGGARCSSNNGKTSRSADRGAIGNQEVHLVGALAELFLLRRAIEDGDDVAVSYMRRHIYSENGGEGINGPDAMFRSSSGSSVRIDAKAFRTGRNRTIFSINDRKHQKLNGQCDFYFCCLTKKFSRTMSASRLVPYQYVSTWECRNLMSNGMGSDSRNIELKTLMSGYFHSESALSDVEESSVFQEDRILSMSRSQSVRDRLQDMLQLRVPL